MTNVGTVTLLFTDLVGSTALLEQLGDDGAEQLRRTHFRLLREAVASTGGHEVKNLGDGLMVAFVSAVDALACAAAMQQAVHRYNEKGAAQPLAAQALEVRIGLHVGEPIRDEEDYFGRCVVIARRLCERATGGQILVSELVHQLAGSRGGHRFHELGALPLKGLSQPLAACELLWDPAPPPRFPLPPWLAIREQMPFVGRGPHIEQLRKAWSRVQAGQRQLVLVSGEPGIGKTRLVAEFARAAHDEGAVVLLGRSTEETLTPYQPFVEALRLYVTAAPVHQLQAWMPPGGAELKRLVPELDERLPSLPAPLGGDAEGQRYRLFDAVASLLAAVSRAAPVVLLLEDIHWADKPTLLLLRYLVRFPEGARLFALGTYRETEITQNQPLAETIADLRRDQLFERLSLEGLGVDDVAELIRGLAGGQEPSSDFVRAVHDQTEGNPFFIGEVLRHLTESGALEQREGRWTRNVSVDELGIPEAVKDVIGRRLARVSDECNRVLVVASVMGREFDLNVLERAGELFQDPLGALEEALGAQLISEVPRPAGRYTFTHALIRETLYTKLTVARRARLHRRIGEVLEQLYAADPDPHLSELARHFLAAAPSGDVSKAIAYARRAGARAVAQLAYEEAAGHYVRSLQALRLADGDEKQRCILLLELAEAQSRAGDRDKAKCNFQQAAAIALDRSMAAEVARAALGFESESTATEVGIVDHVLVDLLEAALAALAPDDSPLRARVLAKLAEALYWAPDHERLVRLADEATKMARRIGDPATTAFVLHDRLFATRGIESLVDRAATAAEVIRLAEEARDVEAALLGHTWRLGALLGMGDIHAVDLEIEALTRMEEALRQPEHLRFSTLACTMRMLLEGRFPEAEQLALQTQARAQHAPDRHAALGLRQAFAVQLFILRREAARLAEIEPALRAFAEQYPTMPSWRCGLTVVFADLGREADACREFVQLAAGDFASIPRDLGWFVCMTLLAEACHFLRDRPRAAVLYRLLAPYAEQCVVFGSIGVACSGSVSRYLGLLAATMGDWTAAVRHFEDALTVHRRMGAHPWVAHTQRDYAEMLLERGAGDDRARARSLLDDALSAAHALGMPALLERATALVRVAESAAGAARDLTTAPALSGSGP